MSSSAQKTEWDAYYARPAATAQFTRKITERRLIGLMRDLVPDQRSLNVCELGGANSCFAEAVLAALPVTRYHIVDNNELGLRMLEDRFGNNATVSWEHRDVLDPELRGGRFDLVYSVGLVEHFDAEGTAKAIACHLRLARRGGAVLMTFPTPTWLYRGTRRFLEAIGRWAFPDERPLGFAEVEHALTSTGARILCRRINWAIMLTQGVVAARLESAPHLLGL